MNILYGIVGEGLGHATRSGVLIEYLLQQGHHVRIVASGKALPYTTKRLASHPNVQIEEIFGLHFAFDDNKVNMPKTLWSNISQAPQGLTKNIRLYYKMRDEGYRPDLVLSDFESWTQLYALNHRLPLISFDNQQALTRCKHEGDIFKQKGLSYHLTQMAVKGKMPNASNYNPKKYDKSRQFDDASRARGRNDRISATGGGPATLESTAATLAFGITFGIAFTTASVTARLRALALPLGNPNDSFTWEATDVATSSRGSVGFVTGGNTAGFDAFFTASFTSGRENDEDDFFASTGLPDGLPLPLPLLWDPFVCDADTMTIVTRR